MTVFIVIGDDSPYYTGDFLAAFANRDAAERFAAEQDFTCRVDEEEVRE